MSDCVGVESVGSWFFLDRCRKSAVGVPVVEKQVSRPVLSNIQYAMKYSIIINECSNEPYISSISKAEYLCR